MDRPSLSPAPAECLKSDKYSNGFKAEIRNKTSVKS